MTKRVTYQKEDRSDRGDYVDARFDVLLDGEKVGQVLREDRRVATHGYANSRLGYTTTGTAWTAEARGYRSIGDYPTRMDAVIDLLRRTRGLDYNQAREAVGKKGLR